MMFQLDTEGGKRLYVQIYEYIKSEIKGGRLLKGEKLPSTRILAENLQVSRSTVDLAYEQLVSEGYLEARAGSGYYVGQIDELYDFGIGMPKETNMVQPQKQYIVDFSTGAVEMRGFPFGTWRKLNKKILSEDNASLFALGDPQGDLELRKTIARYLHASRGANISPEQLVIGAGNEYLLLLLEKILGRHQKIAMEKPTYSKAYRSFESFAYDIYRIPMDTYGIQIQKLRECEADIAYVMPSHQYPTGLVMPIGRRQELLKWADERPDRYIIEDDHDSEFRYKGKPIPCLQSIDRHGKVIYMGTFSKAIAPAIRISFMALPKPLLTKYQTAFRFFSSTVPRMDQRMLQLFIEEGHFERHLNRMRKTYRIRHDEMLQLLKPFRKKFHIQGENAGTYLVLKSKEGLTEQELIQRAEQVGVKVYGMSQHLMSEEECYDGILLGFGGLSVEEIQMGLTLLSQVYL